MKNIFLIVPFTLISLVSSGQLSKQLTKMWEDHKYKEIIAVAAKLDMYNTHDDTKIVDELVGRSYYAMQQYDSAVYFENNALSLDNDATWVSAWAYTYRGKAMYWLGKKEESIQDLQKAIALGKTGNSVESATEFLDNINNNSVPDEKYTYYYSQGEYKKAIAAGRQELEKQDYKAVLAVMGDCYYKIHEFDSAIYFERKTIAADQDATDLSAWAHIYLGMALFDKNKKDECIDELRTAIALNKTPNSVHKAENFLNEIINGRALAIDSLHQSIKDRLGNSEYRAAASIARNAITANPGDALGWSQLSNAYHWLHNYDSSIYCAQQVLALDKDATQLSSMAHYHLGICRFMKNDKEAANTEFALAINDHTNSELKKKVQWTSKLMGLTDNYDDWKTVEHDHIVFHFPDRNSFDDELMDKYEKEYTNANTVLPVTLPRKIDVYVWNGMILGKYLEQLDKELSAPLEYCVIHTSHKKDQTIQILNIFGKWAQK